MSILLRSTLQPPEITQEILERFDIYREEKEIRQKSPNRSPRLSPTAGWGFPAKKCVRCQHCR